MTRTASSGRSADRWLTVVEDGARLRQLRRQHGLSQAELAGKAGVSMSTMIRLERRPQPSCRSHTAARIGTALGQSKAAFTGSQPPADHAAR